MPPHASKHGSANQETLSFVSTTYEAANRGAPLVRRKGISAHQCSTRVPRPLIDLTRDHGLKSSPSDPSCWIYISFFLTSPLVLQGGKHCSCHYLLLAISLSSWEMHTVAQGRRGALTHTPYAGFVAFVLQHVFWGGPRPSKWVQTSLTSGGLETYGELDSD